MKICWKVNFCSPYCSIRELSIQIYSRRAQVKRVSETRPASLTSRATSLRATTTLAPPSASPSTSTNQTATPTSLRVASAYLAVRKLMYLRQATEDQRRKMCSCSNEIKIRCRLLQQRPQVRPICTQVLQLLALSPTTPQSCQTAETKHHLSNLLSITCRERTSIRHSCTKTTAAIRSMRRSLPPPFVTPTRTRMTQLKPSRPRPSTITTILSPWQSRTPCKNSSSSKPGGHFTTKHRQVAPSARVPKSGCHRRRIRVACSSRQTTLRSCSARKTISTCSKRCSIRQTAPTSTLDRPS